MFLEQMKAFLNKIQLLSTKKAKLYLLATLMKIDGTNVLVGYTFLLQDPKQSAIEANDEGRVIEMGICGKCIHKDKVGIDLT